MLTPVNMIIWALRDQTLEEAASYQDALKRLSKVPIITPIYYIVAGVLPGEGAVVTRNRSGAADVWELDPLHGQWFRVESKEDQWKPIPDGDKRRIAAMEALNTTGQGNIHLDSLFNVLSANLTCNRITIYTTVMSAGTPEKYHNERAWMQLRLNLKIYRRGSRFLIDWEGKPTTTVSV